MATHVYQEESDWFQYMREFAPAEAQAHATARYKEEYGRYIEGGPHLGGLPGEPRSFAGSLNA